MSKQKSYSAGDNLVENGSVKKVIAIIVQSHYQAPRK